MNVKYAKNLKRGDKTPWYEVIEDAAEGTRNDGICIIIRVEWNDGGRDYRVFDDPFQKVEVLP